MNHKHLCICIIQLGCTNPSWTGDGYCDDINNIVECNFDGGDCCGPNVNTAYCNQCQCLTGDNSQLCHSTNPDIWSCCSSQNPCEVDEGDCDLDNHCLGNLFCGVDNCPNDFPSGADCCKDGVATTISLTTCSPVFASAIGDGFCDDTNNMVECNFDGGDCCGPDVNTNYCTQCQCLTGD